MIVYGNAKRPIAPLAKMSAGTATNVCCESTARSAFFHDYQVVMLSDATATFDRAMHEATLRTIDMFFGRVMTVAELLKEFDEDVVRTP